MTMDLREVERWVFTCVALPPVPETWAWLVLLHRVPEGDLVEMVPDRLDPGSADVRVRSGYFPAAA